MSEAFTTAQKEAYLNEYKGVLFEFLCANFLWTESKNSQETAFVSKISPPLLQILSEAEEFLRQTDPDLLCKLPKLAQETAGIVLANIQGKIIDIELIGKISGGKSEWKEADLIVYEKDKFGKGVIRPISIKLCKSDAFVNTKSGGIKSFIQTYFCDEEANGDSDIERFLDMTSLEFEAMAFELHRHHGLEYLGDWKSWQDLGLPMLPGQLATEDRQRLLHFYHQSILGMHQCLKNIYMADPESFINKLRPIMGMGLPHLAQVICFYDHKAEGRYRLNNILYHDQNWQKDQMESLQFCEVKPGQASFEIKLKKAVLQIRLKPMNTFTVPGLKVNCSVYYG